jgi:hypothetical protein
MMDEVQKSSNPECFQDLPTVHADITKELRDYALKGKLCLNGFLEASQKQSTLICSKSEEKRLARNSGLTSGCMMRAF